MKYALSFDTAILDIVPRFSASIGYKLNMVASENKCWFAAGVGEGLGYIWIFYCPWEKDTGLFTCKWF